MSEKEKAGSMKRVNRVLLEFDTNKIPEGDVASQQWLDRIYDAFMRDRFDSLPNGVCLAEAAAVQQESCTCHERDSSYSCDFCKRNGIKGHMER